METHSIYCPSCKRENSVGNRFCRFCGRLLVEPDAEAMAYAPPYSSEGDAPGADVAAQADVTRARLLIRALPPDAQDSFVGGPPRVGEYALEGRTVTIGRAHNCDIIFGDDNLASRRHAILRREAHHYTIADLGSSNGTFLNDVEVRERMPLHHGDRLLIGQHELLFLLEQPQPITAPQPAAASAAGAASAPEMASATAALGDAAVAPVSSVAEAAAGVAASVIVAEPDTEPDAESDAELGATTLLAPTSDAPDAPDAPDVAALSDGSALADALDAAEVEAPPPLPPAEALDGPEAPVASASSASDAEDEEAQSAGPTAARVTGRPAMETGETGKYASVAQLSSEVAASAWRLMAPPSEGDDLDAMRARLREASDALTRQAGLQAALAEQRRRLIASISADLSDLIASLSDESAAEAGADGWEAERAQTLQTLEALHARLQERA